MHFGFYATFQSINLVVEVLMLISFLLRTPRTQRAWSYHGIVALLGRVHSQKQVDRRPILHF